MEFSEGVRKIVQNCSSVPVVDFDVLVSLRVVHEPHQLQMEDRREGEELYSFFCFLWDKKKREMTIFIRATLNMKIFLVFCSSNNGRH